MDSEGHIRTAQSCATDPGVAVREFCDQIWQPGLCLVTFFCSSTYDLDTLAKEMEAAFPGVQVVGCTTAGEIGPAGYRQGSLAGAGFPGSHYGAETGLLESVQDLDFGQTQEFVQTRLRQLEAACPPGFSGHTFGLLMIDGLSTREEAVTHALQSALRDIPLVGGSAGDDLKFAGTWVYHGGRFHRDAAVLSLVRTAYPFRAFKTQHFIYQEERLVVTSADTNHRIVHELNGLPAAQEYARLIGASVEELTPQRFAASPVVVLIDGTDYVRSIQKANPDGSLTFYCAIDVGLILRVARGVDLLDDLEKTLRGLRKELGQFQAMLTFDCILRNLELEQKGLKSSVGDLLRRHHAVGFSTYGEQFGGVHNNQTLSGIAIGARERPADGKAAG